SRSPMMPEPTTALSNSDVPKASDANLRPKVIAMKPSGTAARSATALRLRRPNKSTHEFTVDVGRNRIDIDSLARQKGACIFDVINTRRLDGDVFKTSSGEFRLVFVLFERTRDATDPQQDSIADLRRHRA